ncbi:hypothetical protein CCMSSC00406_0007394 [Pleurotus cornucopiae]|uniref:Uncharacterized protein n=1 Tax=Pleurotus cornucopiae TaxID=5321 RepID=A0ACB7IU17_PLECO|nr:hypothetical protein CCMSSC00406_0007394 [Pleurotus cornucopiae]
MVELPIELIYRIVAYLDDRHNEQGSHRGERIPTSLLACSLVCRSWVAICQSHIFHTVALSYNKASRLSYSRREVGSSAYNKASADSFIDFFLFTAPPSLQLCSQPQATFAHLGASGISTHASRARLMHMVSFLGIVSLLSALHLKRLELNNWTVSNPDASDLLPILVACQRTLRELTLEIIGVRRWHENPQQVHSESRPSSPVVCFDALRHLTLSQNMKSLPTINFIECPNLESLKMANHGDDPWHIPQWIPASVSHLILNVLPDIPLPNLGTTICPSELTINMIDAEDVEYLDTMTWIQECLDKLPHPGRLQQITILIDVLYEEPRASERSDYEPLYCALQRLHGHGGLKHINFNIINDHDEVSTFKGVFAEMLEEISAEVEGGRIDLHMRFV